MGKNKCVLIISSVRKFLLLFLTFLIFTPVAFSNGQDSTSRGKKHRDGRFFIRGAIGAQGGFSLFFPTDLNNYTKDFWNALIDKYYPDENYSGKNEAIPIIIGFHYDLKIALRIFNIVQLEAWKENFYGIGLQIKTEMYRYEYGTGYNEYLSAKYQFVPSYSSFGGNILFTPGAKRKSTFFTIGGGIGQYKGEFKYHEEGTHTINDTTSSFNNTQVYHGSTIGFNFIIGVTIAPLKFLEIESFFFGRYVKIPFMTNESGQKLVNPYRGNEVITMDYTGGGMEIGIKIILP